MQRPRQLHSYSSSSASSVSSPDDYSDAAYGTTDGPPPSSLPLFRRNSSLESQGAHGYESPEPDEEIEDETHSHAVANQVETLSLSTGCLRTPRTLLPRSIDEEPGDDSSRDSAPPPVPVYADVAMARTRSMPLPRHEARGPFSALASPAPASAANPSSSSHLPVSQPGWGSSQSWTPGLAPPAPYTAITPLSPQLEDPADRFDFQLEGGPLSFAPLLPHAADADDLPPPIFGDGADFEALSRAPPPSRNPSLMRQKGVYNEATSRALSMPSGARALLQQRLARQVREQEEQRSQPQLHLQVAAPSYPARRYDDDDPDILPPHNPSHR